MRQIVCALALVLMASTAVNGQIPEILSQPGFNFAFATEPELPEAKGAVRDNSMVLFRQFMADFMNTAVVRFTGWKSNKSNTILILVPARKQASDPNEVVFRLSSDGEPPLEIYRFPLVLETHLKEEATKSIDKLFEVIKPERVVAPADKKLPAVL